MAAFLSSKFITAVWGIPLGSIRIVSNVMKKCIIIIVVIIIIIIIIIIIRSGSILILLFLVSLSF